ncbi:MAG: DUF1566 domain-containing protein, partial [Bacteroidia bacterium]|nr:DUF1566 domain-containing protein [Bacteroidia bacterium]
YQRLLDNSVPKEAVFASYFKFLESVTDLDALLEGYRWLESKGYENAKESMYTLAGEMVIDARYLDAHGIFSSLGEYKDARNKAAELTRKVVYNTQGADTDVLPHIVVYGEKIVEPAQPIKEGYVFAGWYTDKALTIQWDFATYKVFSNLVLYSRWRAYDVGDIGSSGGHVFYDKGDYNGGWRYLEAAPKQSEFNNVWGGTGTAIGGTNTIVGTGEVNTEKIVSKFGKEEPYRKKAEYAAKLCADLVVTKNGVVYDDWFLPSKGELNLMYKNLKKNNLGSFSSDWYWSSSEGNSDSAWGQNFYSGSYGNNNRSAIYKVRPIRAF